MTETNAPQLQAAQLKTRRTATRKALEWLLLTIAIGGLFAIVVQQLYGTLQFAEDAIRKAGDTPPTHVAMRLEALRRWQGVGNTALILASMGGIGAGLLSAWSEIAGPRGRRSALNVTTALLLGVVAGSLAGVAGWLLYRLRPIGDQNLALASLIQSVTWGLLGFGTGLALGGCSGLRCGKVAPVILCSTAWGLVAPALLTVLFPMSYVGTVIPTDLHPRMFWAAGGGIALVVGVAYSGLINRRPSEAALASTVNRTSLA